MDLRGTSRRTFLTFLSLVPGLGALLRPALPALAAPPRASDILLERFFVAGLRYHDGVRVAPLVLPGDAVLLEAEPTNRWDPQAVRLLWGDAMLGYVPRHLNRAMSAILLQGGHLVARVTAVDVDAPPWERVQVAVYLPR
ncbi:MAG: hypothetical protein AMXMBFR64_00460 [Myxococcales bacterium]